MLAETCGFKIYYARETRNWWVVGAMRSSQWTPENTGKLLVEHTRVFVYDKNM